MSVHNAQVQCGCCLSKRKWEKKGSDRKEKKIVKNSKDKLGRKEKTALPVSLTKDEDYLPREERKKENWGRGRKRE